MLDCHGRGRKRPIIAGALLLSLLGHLPGAAQGSATPNGAGQTGSAPLRAADFLDSLGVATHIDYTDSAYAKIDSVIAALRYLGIDRVRDHAPNPNSDPVGQGHLRSAAAAGIRFVFTSLRAKPDLVVARVRDFVTANPGSVLALEGPNEVNNWPVTFEGQSGTAGAQAYQRQLYELAKADPLLAELPVLGFTDYPAHSSQADWNNIHPYPKNGDQPFLTIRREKLAQEKVDPGRPFAVTETGYHTSLTANAPASWEGVDEATQAKLILNLYLDAAKLGSRFTFVYQLVDAYPDPDGADMERHFGLFDINYNPKPAATAIHNLTSILRDAAPGSGAVSAKPVAVSFKGLPATARTLLLQQASGAYALAIWNEPDLWDEGANAPIASNPVRVTVDLEQRFGSVKVFNPLTGSDPVDAFTQARDVEISLADHAVILQMIPEPAATSN